MCGIIGMFGKPDSALLVKKGLELLKVRGRDSHGSITIDQNIVGHTLHSVVGRVRQPLKAKGILVANCEIYNWRELCQTHNLKAKNDADLILRLIEKKGRVCDAAKFLDGDYAFCYWKDDEVVLARDIIGVKPIFFSHADGFSFASEKKVLEKLGVSDIHELNPRNFLTYNIEQDRIYFTQRKFFDINPRNNTGRLQELLINAVKKRIPNTKFGLLFSGGVDSSVLALILKELGADFTCYTTALDEPTMSQAKDQKYAEKVAKKYGLKLKIKKLRIKDIEPYLKKVVPLIEDTNVTKVGVALTFYPALEMAKKDGVKVIFSGLGSEEIFGGYQRHKRALDINKECVSGLLKMYERDTYRDDVISMANGIELRVPYLDIELIRYALKIPGSKKIAKGSEKVILREVAEKLGLAKEFAWRKKQAAQYGSKVNRALKKLAKKKGHALISSYMKTFYKSHNLRIGALVSGGKDSLYAMYVMHRQNYEVPCMITIKSKNPDSYMFHTPAIDIVDLQAKSMGIPMVAVATKGKKEAELEDLKKALKKAKDKYRLDGVITGALYSTYQRDRIEKICDKLGLKVFSPLWHINQETEMQEILRNNFEIIFTKVAAEGLDKSWLGRKITYKDIARLAKLNKKIGLNIAGEGGEFESLVLDMPLFKKKIKLKKSRLVMENQYTGTFEINEAELHEKEKTKG